MEKAEKVQVELNKYYDVACAKMVLKDNGYTVFVPVHPNSHKDPQFGKIAAIEHYHVDGRFFREEYVAGISMNEGRTNQAIFIGDKNASYQFKGIERKRRKCIRLETGLDINFYRTPTSWEKWYKTMIGKPIKENKCPHFGTIMSEINGKLICPMHNLEGCLKTKKIIKPLSQIQ